MGESLIRQAFDQVGVPVVVHSAGLLEGGRAVSSVSVAVLRNRGDLVRGADLVLVMERHHARELSLMAPEAIDRIHLYRTLSAEAERSTEAPAGGLRGWAEALGRARPHQALLGDGRPDEVRDPHGRSARLHRTTADELERGARSLARLAARSAPLDR
jgi:protein-tyrosine-phosphatase